MVWIPLGVAEWFILFWVTLNLTLTSDLISSFFVSIPLYQITKPQILLMLDQIILGYLSRYGDICCLDFALYFYYHLCHYNSSKMPIK